MQEAVEPSEAARKPWVSRVFWGIVVVGILLRGIAAVYSIDIVHPDEHQQYVEQAQALAFGGPAVKFWEQERGMRNLFYPYLLAGLLYFMEGIGIQDPFAQAACLRFILATAILLLFAWYAWRDLGKGHLVRALALIFLASLTTSVIYVNVRFLSENAMMIPLLLGLLYLERSPGLAGWWFGVMFAVRFQSGFMILGFCLVVLVEDLYPQFPPLRTFWKTRTFRLGLGLLVSICLFVGLLDRLTLGGWFHSPLEYVQANIIENKSADYGVEEWYWYLGWLGAAFLGTSVLSLFFFVLGAIKKWKLAFVCLLHLLGHSVVAHKEFRFLWGALPLCLILISQGMESTWNWWATRRRRALVANLALASFVLGSLVYLFVLQWNEGSYVSSAQALAVVRKQPNATGVAICGQGDASTGNYFFLRRAIPLVFVDSEDIATRVPSLNPMINYLILPSNEPMPLPPKKVHFIADCGELKVYEIRASEKENGP